LEEGEVIVGATFQLASDDPVTIAGRVRNYLEKRRTSQQIGYPNAGSFFKNPEGLSAWQLIDAAGLRGASVGGAQVSEAHSNFIVNRGNAMARDIITLAALVKERVKEATGVSLNEEVKIVGEDGQL
jgi:UDP-N-acetylmuramate dehydrogenase